jgi:hypothetical protein
MHLAKPASPSRWRERCAAVLVVTIAAIPGASAFVLGRTGGGAVTVQMKRAGSGPGARTVGGVRIVDGSTAEVLAATTAGVRGRVKVSPPPGVEFAVASVVRPKGLREGVSPVFAYDGGAGPKLRIALEPATAAVGARAVISRPLAAPSNMVATLGAVTIAGPDGVPVSIAGPLFTPLFNDTSDFLRWVDTSEAVQRARQREIELQEQGLTDPSTHIADRPLAPDLRIEGALTTDGRDVTGELRIVDPTTGEVLERIAVDTQGHDWGDLLAELARRVANRLRDRHATTTTSTTVSTMVSTSTTSIAPPPTTTTTSGRPTTTTTLASRPCTSVIPASFCRCSGGTHTTCSSDAICQQLGEATCVDIVGHTVVTFRLAGSGARLGALQIDGGDDGLVDVLGGVGVRIGCGSAGITEGAPVAVPAGDIVCPTFYHPGRTVTVTARRELPPSPFLGDLYCASTFTGFSGAVGCAGMGDCNKLRCTCSIVTGAEKTEIIATYESIGTGCVPATAP